MQSMDATPCQPQPDVSPQSVRPDPRTQIYWENIFALVLVHVGAAIAFLYCALVVFSWWTAGLALALGITCTLSITGGYHRLFAHRAYKGSTALRVFYILFGSGCAQASVLRWSSDHRLHHAATDEENDPHNIRKGFWWAHMGWLCYRTESYPERRNVSDLLNDPVLRFQDRHYLVLMLAVGFLLPCLVAALWGDAMGGLLVAGFARLLIQYHATFCINSVAHTIGTRPYTTDDSARDSHVAALLTLGEGYHNFHHRFPGDYRNGVRALAFDPTKWWVWGLDKVGLARDLKRAPERDIARARELVLSKSREADPVGTS